MRQHALLRGTVPNLAAAVLASVLVLAGVALAAPPARAAEMISDHLGLAEPPATAPTLSLGEAAGAPTAATPARRTPSSQGEPGRAGVQGIARGLQSASAQPLQAGSAPTPSQGSTASRPRVGIQAGHRRAEELPNELASLRTSTGAAGKGWREVDVNLDLARRVAALLEQAGVQVDLIPSTVPVSYEADAFVAIHGDANSNTGLSGYKLARARWSTIPETDDALLRALGLTYGERTGLQEHPKTITENMRQYYAFNHRLKHSVDPATPAVILETGFLTNAGDLKLLTHQPDLVARAIADGVLKFLGQ